MTLITWEHITWHHIASRDIAQHKKSHRIKWHDTTSHHMTWHDISQLTTLPHLTSPHNQPHYFISPCNQPHQNRSITTMEWMKARSLKKLGLGIAAVGHPVHILQANSFFDLYLFLWNFRPRLARLYLYMYHNVTTSICNFNLLLDYHWIQNGLNMKNFLTVQSMCHHLNFSGLCRPENWRKTSLVYDVEVCPVLNQYLSCVSLGCSRLLPIWGTPHQCFLHQLYNICVLQVCSKHWI